MSVDSYFIIAFIIIISPFLLLFFRTILSLCERLFRLCHVTRAATLTTICSFFAKRAATEGKRIPKMFRLLKFQATFKPQITVQNNLKVPPSSQPTQSGSVRFAQCSKNSWHPLRIVKPSFQQALRVLIVSWPGKTGMVKRKFIVMGVPTPASKVPRSANALNSWHSRQSTPTSENYELYLRKPNAAVNGTPCQAQAILPLHQRYKNI